MTYRAILNEAQLQQILRDNSPGSELLVESVTDVGVICRLPIDSRHQRPGGTVSGPSVMSLADALAWLVIMSRIGPVVLAVTTSLHVDFLRKPAMADLVGTGELLKLGKRLAVVEVGVTSVASSELVAKAQVTYSIPPE